MPHEMAYGLEASSKWLPSANAHERISFTNMNAFGSRHKIIIIIIFGHCAKKMLNGFVLYAKSK